MPRKHLLRVSRVGVIGNQFAELRILGPKGSQKACAVLSHSDITVLVRMLHDAQKCITDGDNMDTMLTVPQP